MAKREQISRAHRIGGHGRREQPTAGGDPTRTEEVRGDPVQRQAAEDLGGGRDGENTRAENGPAAATGGRRHGLIGGESTKESVATRGRGVGVGSGREPGRVFGLAGVQADVQSEHHGPHGVGAQPNGKQS